MTLQNISFSYPNNDKKIFNNINLEIESGKTYAFIGPTGEGKSTLVMLLSGLIEPTSGQIILEGKNINSWDKEELSNHIGYILQEPFLFEGTILDNIIYGNNDFLENYICDEYTKSIDYLDSKSQYPLLKEKVEKVLIERGLEKLISKFSDGLDTKVTNNSENISLGQKQIINFLRVILREPKFLILDEATANLDTITEQLLQNILDSLPKTTTKIIIAHRLNTVKKADYKYLVGAGKITLIKK
jgi:ATP-binding cassette, subfamily B, bacterial